MSAKKRYDEKHKENMKEVRWAKKNYLLQLMKRKESNYVHSHSEEDRQCTNDAGTEARSRNHYCRGKAALHIVCVCVCMD